MELLLISVDVSPSSLVPGQIFYIPYAENAVDVCETL